MRFNAATILPSEASSPCSPSSSPHAVLTAGATWTTVIFSGSASAANALSVSSRSLSAPVGQWVIHCPHRVQSEQSMVLLSATSTVVRDPVFCTSQTCMAWTLSQICTHRIHLMHFLESLIRGKEWSQGVSGTSSVKGTSRIPRSLDIFCKLQLRLLTQIAQ